MSINTKNIWSTKALIGVKNVNEKCGRQKQTQKTNQISKNKVCVVSCC